MNQALADLKQRLAEIYDLERALGVMGWDQRTMMPPKGAAARAEAAATLSGVIHERFISDEIGRLLDQVASLETELGHDSDDASLVRVTRREWEKARRVPAEIAAAWAREGGKAHVAWLEAREQNDFSIFLPALRRVHDVALRWAELMEQGDSPYDAFLDEYEPGMTTAEVKAVFDVLQPELTAIVRDAGEPADNSFLEGDFPIPAQEEFLAGILRDFGFEEGAYRLDPTVHPFATSFTGTDIRMTTRYKPDNLRALWAAMHEAGHGLTYQGVDPALGRSPLYGNASLGLGESQSRTWENLVGRSLPFWRGRYPELQRLFPQLEAVELDDFFRGINRVAPGLIRVDADEVTYSLHIILRFELEQELVAGTLALEDLPEAWNARMKAFLGIDVPDDAARRAPGRPLDARVVRLLPHLRPRERALGADLAGGRGGDTRPRRAARGGRVRAALRVAADAALPARPQVHADGDARARDRRGPDRPAAVSRIPARQGRRAPARLDLSAPAMSARDPSGDCPRTGLAQTCPRVNLLQQVVHSVRLGRVPVRRLRAVEDVLARSQALVESFEKLVRDELPKDLEIFDAHVHLGTDIDGRVGDFDELVAGQERYGISGAFMFCLDEPDRHPAFSAANDRTLAFAARSNGQVRAVRPPRPERGSDRRGDALPRCGRARHQAAPARPEVPSERRAARAGLRARGRPQASRS